MYMLSGVLQVRPEARMFYPEDGGGGSGSSSGSDDEYSGWVDGSSGSGSGSGSGTSSSDDEYPGWLGDSSGSGSDVENYRIPVPGRWSTPHDGESGGDGWWSGGSGDEEPFRNDGKNVEVPISSVDGGSENAEADTEGEASTYLMLSFVGDELGDGACPRSGGGSLVQKRVRQTLPQEVLEAVLLRLPAKSQARCRAVCKAWLAMLSSPDFLRRNFYYSLSSLVTPPVCAFEHCVHDSEDDSDSDDEREPAKNVRGPSHKSLKVDLSFLPKVFHSRSAEVHSWSQSGLICIGCMSYTRSELHLCVVNPLNQIFKVLPMLTNPRGRGGLMTGRAVLITEGITGAEDIPSFKVYLHAASDTKVEMAIYSSTSGEWKGFVGTPSNSSERDGYDDDEERPSLPMACNGGIYTLVGSTRPRLVRLSMDRGPRYLWDLTLPRFMQSRDHQRENKYFLADHRGRLLCCCGGIKMLDDVTQQWIEIADICPPEILPPCNPAKKHTLTLEKVQVAGDLVVFFHQVDIRRGKAGDHVDCPVAYDMLRRCWQKIPGKIFHIGDLFQALPNLWI